MCIKIFGLIIGEVMFTPIYNDKPIKLLRVLVGKKRYSKKLSAVKLKKIMNRVRKSIYDINEVTEIRVSSLEKYTSKDCKISMLNMALIASFLGCGIEELTE